MEDSTLAKTPNHKEEQHTRERALVRMFETVTASHWTNLSEGGEIHDLQQLLLMMDIGSCASAEKHTGVNCVTASMGDVIVEYFPKVGELLELTASPVSVGRTSLDIAVLVQAHGEETHRVCEAFFTYVTTRGPNNEKRLAPPLEESNNIVPKWEQTMGVFRKQLILSERRALAKRHQEWRFATKRRRPIFESSEVVLPSHQNHMGHLFGGVVMGWMCKSVMAACVKATKLPQSMFRIRSIQRVDFPTGADVGDHIFFRPSITAVFEEGRSAEIEIMVGKRSIIATNNNENNNEECTNVGYFYVSGVTSYHPKTDSAFSYREFNTHCRNKSNSNSNSNNETTTVLPTSVAPFAELDKNLAQNTLAYQRRKFMLARAHLLGGIGESIEWEPSMEAQAPILTILSVLRMCEEYQTRKRQSEDGPDWKVLPNTITNTTSSIEWAEQRSSGLYHTLLLRGKTIIERPYVKDGFLEEVYVTLRDKRPQWDPACSRLTILETKAMEQRETVAWDVTEYLLQTGPEESKFCLLRCGAYVGEDGSISGENTSTGVLASRSVVHPDSDAIQRVLPSGWLLKKLDPKDGIERLEITYVAEIHDCAVQQDNLFLGTELVAE